MLSVKNLEVVYQDVILVLRGISFEIPKGEIVALLGSNGSGKTTVIRSITGLLDVQNGDITKGSISVDGEDITDAKPSKIVEKGIAQVLEGRRIFAELTVVENLRLGGHTSSKEIPENIDRVLDLFPILKERSKGEAGYLSGGEQQMLAIGRALMTNPKLLILDEATEGLAPLIRQEIWRVLETLKQRDQAILVIDKNIDALTHIADRHYIVEKGVVVWHGDSHTLRADEAVQHRYLGV